MTSLSSHIAGSFSEKEINNMMIIRERKIVARIVGSVQEKYRTYRNFFQGKQV